MDDDLSLPTYRELAAAVARRWLIVVIVAVLVAAALIPFLAGRSRSVTRTTTVLIAPTVDNGPLVTVVSPQGTGDAERKRMTQDVALDAAEAAAGHAYSIGVNPLGDSGYFEISASASKPATAAADADSFARFWLDRRTAEITARLDAEKATISAQIDALTAQGASAARLAELQSLLDRTQLLEADLAHDVVLVTPADPTGSAPPVRLPLLVVALLAALTAGVGTALVVELAFGGARRVSDLARAVPGAGVAAVLAPSAPAARLAVVELRLASEARGASPLAVVGAPSAAPAVAVAGSLAQLDADLGLSVCVVDVAAPAGEAAGLGELIAGQPAKELPAATAGAVVKLGPGRAAVAPELLVGAGFARAVAALVDRYDRVIVTGLTGDGAGLGAASAAGAVVLAVAVGTPARAVRRLGHDLDAAGVPVVGVVLVDDGQA